LTISTTSNATIALGDGLTTSFDFSFPVPLASDLFVAYTDANGTVTQLTAAQYSVVGIGTQNGGAVTYPLTGSPIATGTSLFIQRIVPYQQLTSLVNQSGYYPNVVEAALDYLTFQTQQLAENNALALRVPFATIAADLVFPSAAGRANTVAGFDANGNAVVYPITSGVGAGDMRTDIFVAGTDFTPGTTTVVTLSRVYGSTSNIEVFFDASYQGPDQIQSLAGASLTFSSPIPVGVERVYVRGGTTISIGTPASRTVGDSQLTWGNILNRAVDSIAALRALSGGIYTRAFVTGYYAPHDGGGGAYQADPFDITTADNGGTVIVGADGTRWKLSYAGIIWVQQFGARADNSTDNAVPFANIQAFQAAQAALGRAFSVAFAGGTYKYSVSPNWALNDAQMEAHGTVRLVYTGTGDAFIFDAGPTQFVYGQQVLGNFIIQAPGTAGDAIYIRSWHHGKMEATVRGAGIAAAGIRIVFAVCSDFDIEVGFGGDGTWLGGKPGFGLLLATRTGGEACSYLNFRNPVIESCTNGIYLSGALGCQFYGGTSEAHTGIGVTALAATLNNTFYSMDFEVNAQDIFDAGNANRWIGIDAQDSIEFSPTCVGAKFIGCIVNSITVDSGALGVLIADTTYSRLGTGSLIDNGTHTRLRDNRNAATNVTENTPLGLTSISPTGSPFVYTNTTGNEQTLLVVGGAVSGISFSRNGVGVATGLTSGMFQLSPTDAIAITYSSTPGVEMYTR
jgi:hypothetical protein